MSVHEPDQIRVAVQERYAAVARSASSCCGPSSANPSSDSDPFGQSHYDEDARGALPQEALVASLGCGNPTLLADLRPGEVVLDLGSGGGIDVLLSARRVAPDGLAYGLDMTPEMLELANANKTRAGVENVEFLLGNIEDIPLPDSSVDVVISNCVVNLSADKNRVFREAYRVLRPGGRLAISDVVLTRPLSAQLTSVMALWTGCIAGALTEDDCAERLRSAGFESVDIDATNVFGRPELEGLVADLSPQDLDADFDVEATITQFDGVIRSAAIRATKPGKPASKENHVPLIRIYEPALCCNTGVCGPDLDQNLVDFTADLNHLVERGANIARHNLANDPGAFVAEDSVRTFLQVAGSEGLPLTVVDGVTVMTGRYPTREQLVRFARLGAEPVTVLSGADGSGVTDSSGGCGPTGCC